jgi:hypothetical protein
MLQTLDREETQNCEIFSINAAQVARLNALFWEEDSKRNSTVVSFVAGSAVAVNIVGFADPVLAAGGGGGGADDAATTIAAGVQAAIDMIRAIQGIGTAAFGAALAPLGFMLTLRILNMVLSRV